MLGIASLFLNKETLSKSELDNTKLKTINNLIYYKTVGKNLSNIFWFFPLIKEVLDNQQCEYELSLSYHSENKKWKDDFSYLNMTNTKIPFTYKLFYNNDVKVFTPTLKVTIHYPEILITNKLNHKLKIYDLFVSFYIDQSGMIKNYIEGQRSSFTPLQLEKGYVHSHLPSSGFNKNTFCLGTGTDILTAKMMFQNAVANKSSVVDFFQLFLMNLNNFVAYESLEGGPYIRISQLTENQKLKIDFKNVELLYALSEMLQARMNIFINYLFDNNAIYNYNDRPLINYSIFSTIVNELVTMYDSQLVNQYSNYFIIYQDGELVQNKTVITQSSLDKIKNKFVVFKKKKIPLTLKESVDLSKIEWKLNDNVVKALYEIATCNEIIVYNLKRKYNDYIFKITKEYFAEEVETL